MKIFYILFSTWFIYSISHNYKNYSLADWSVLIFLYFLPMVVRYFIIKNRKKKNSKTKEEGIFISENNKINFSKEQKAVSEEVIKIHQDSKEINKNTEESIFLENDKITYKINGSINEKDISKLINLGLKNALEKEKKSNNPKFNRTFEDNELSFKFENTHFNKISDFEDRLYSEEKKIYLIFDIDKRIEQCQKVIKTFNSFKNFCYKKSKGGMIYFQDTWEFMYNSKNDCFSYIDETEAYLENLIKNYDEEKITIEKERNKQVKIAKYLQEHNPEEEFLLLLKNKPGILQKDIYKNFDSDIKDIFKPLPRVLEKSGKIIRIKFKNSYQLFIK